MREQSANCKYQSLTERKNAFTCALGFHGGFPYIGNCLTCIENNQNNPEHVERAIMAFPKKREDTHVDPSMRAKARSLAKAALDESKAITQKEPPVSPEVIEQRLAICQGCERFDNGKCKDCGCYMKFKARMRSQHCPQGKW
jgi:hypothetical protein